MDKEEREAEERANDRAELHCIALILFEFDRKLSE